MKQKKLNELSDQELLQERKKAKSIYISYGIIFGMLIGTAIYSSVKNGFDFFTFSPLFFVPIAVGIWASNRAVEKEVKLKKLTNLSYL